jgi:glycine reductase complex component B subunit gamma
MSRIVHYLNQFFAGLGGENAASTPPGVKPGPVGPGKKLQELLGADHEIVATVYCGDDIAAASPAAIRTILELVTRERPDIVLAGPASTSGRYGVACAHVAAAAARAGIAALASMHPENPGLDDAGAAIVIASGASVREMGASLERLALATRKRLAGESLTEADGRIGKVPRKNVLVDRTAASRAVDLLLARLAGQEAPAEVPITRFDHVTPAPPVPDPRTATIALITESGLVPVGNPDRLESARATKWLRYAIEGKAAVATGEFASVHGGYSTVWANADPNRLVPLDVARELEGEGAIGALHGEYFVTTGNGTTVPNARRFGVEWAAELRRAGITAAILTAT